MLIYRKKIKWLTTNKMHSLSRYSCIVTSTSVRCQIEVQLAYPLYYRWMACNTLKFFNQYHAIALTDKDLGLMSAFLWLPAPWQILLGVTFICTDNRNIVNYVVTLLRWEWRGYVWSASQKWQNMNTH